MFAIHEIESENMKSFFPRLFYFLAGSIYEVCGRSGEGAVREAVRCFARNQGEALRREHKENGRKQNTKSYYCAGDFPTDSRKRETILKLTEEECIKEVYTCPYADIWRRYNASNVGNWFCEEYEKAKFEAYTCGYGQAHLSSRLTCNVENNCRFSMYYRLANITPDMAENCFTNERSKEAQPLDFEEAYYLTDTEQCVGFFYVLYQTVSERLGEEGICAIANGLRKLSVDSVAELKRQALHTLHRCDENFAEKNFPLPLHIEHKCYSIDENCMFANRILQKNLLGLILKELE